MLLTSLVVQNHVKISKSISKLLKSIRMKNERSILLSKKKWIKWEKKFELRMKKDLNGNPCYLFFRLMNKYVEPSMQKTRLSEFGIKQRELIEKGVIPENARERITLLKTIHSQIISENPGVILIKLYYINSLPLKLLLINE